MRIEFMGVPLDVLARCGRCGVMGEMTGWPRSQSIVDANPFLTELPAPGEGWGLVPVAGSKVCACAACSTEWEQAVKDATKRFATAGLMRKAGSR